MNTETSDPMINVSFPVQGQKLPADHGYLLYSAISRMMPALHEKKWFGISLISGVPFDKGVIALPARGAKLCLRIPADKFGEVIPLAGKRLEIDGHQIRLGVPLAQPLQPAPLLYSKIVTFRNSTEIEKFLETARRDLIEKLEIKAALELPNEEISRHRRIITVKGKKIVGFSLVVRDLSDEDSIKLQSEGLGGRRSMGCGIFNPISKHYEFEGVDNGI